MPGQRGTSLAVRASPTPDGLPLARHLELIRSMWDLWACGLGPYTFRVRQDARCLRARGPIALLGGFRAERRPIVATKREVSFDG